MQQNCPEALKAFSWSVSVAFLSQCTVLRCRAGNCLITYNIHYSFTLVSWFRELLHFWWWISGIVWDFQHCYKTVLFYKLIHCLNIVLKIDIVSHWASVIRNNPLGILQYAEMLGTPRWGIFPHKSFWLCPSSSCLQKVTCMCFLQLFLLSSVTPD